MIPWKTDNGKSQSFNADISRPIAGLIPKSAPPMGDYPAKRWLVSIRFG